MAVTNIPNVQNWTVTPQNGQSGYFDLMNTWLGQSTLVIASLQTAITAQNAANAEINTLAIETENNAIIATGLANYQGEHNTLTTYSKGQSTSVAGLYYTSKVDGNLNNAVTDTNYWLSNPINDKVSVIGNETIAGIKTFSTSPIVPTPSTTGNIITMDNIIQKTAVGVGYGTGSGGTVTQLTSKSTTVTLNKPTGIITMNNAALVGGSQVVFSFNNNLIEENDIIIPYLIGGGSGENYNIYATGGYPGSCGIWVTNTSGGVLSDALIIQYIIIKGANL